MSRRGSSGFFAELADLAPPTYREEINNIHSDEESQKWDQISDELSTHRPETDRTDRYEDEEQEDSAVFDIFTGGAYSEGLSSDNLLWKRLTDSLSSCGFKSIHNLCAHLDREANSISFPMSQALRAVMYEMLDNIRDKEDLVTKLEKQNESLRVELSRARKCVKMVGNIDRVKSHNPVFSDNEEYRLPRSRNGIPDQVQQLRELLDVNHKDAKDSDRHYSSRSRHSSGSIPSSTAKSVCPCAGSCSYHRSRFASTRHDSASAQTSKHVQYLQDMSDCLNVKDFKDLLPAVMKMQEKTKDVDIMRSTWTKLNASCAKEFRHSEQEGRDSSADPLSNLKEKTERIVNMVEFARTQSVQSRKLVRSLRKLGGIISRGTSTVESNDSLAKMTSYVEILCKEATSYNLLSTITEHLKMLFRVSDINKLFPVINIFYQDFQDLQQLLRNLRNILHLSDAESSHRIQSAVQRLCSLQQETVNDQLRQVLRVNDLQPVLKKLKDYDEFLPVFKNLVQSLCSILNVNSISHIIPAVKELAKVNEGSPLKRYYGRE